MKVGPSQRALRVTAPDPGKLIFDNTAHVFAEYADGKLTFPTSLPIFTDARTSFFWKLDQFAKSVINPDSGSFVLPYGSSDPIQIRVWTEAYFSVVLSILRSVRKHRCGGTLVISKEFYGVQKHKCQLKSDLDNSPDGMPTIPTRMKEYYTALLECDEQRIVDDFPPRYGRPKSPSFLEFEISQFALLLFRARACR